MFTNLHKSLIWKCTLRISIKFYSGGYSYFKQYNAYNVSYSFLITPDQCSLSITSVKHLERPKDVGKFWNAAT
jgi:hypothetical protein